MRTDPPPAVLSAAYHSIQEYLRLASILWRHRRRIGELRFGECLASIKRQAHACPPVQELRGWAGLRRGFCRSFTAANRGLAGPLPGRHCSRLIIAAALLAVGATSASAQTDKVDVAWIVIAALAKELADHGADAETIKSTVRGYVFDAMQKNRQWYNEEDWRESGTLLRVFEGFFNIYAQRAGTPQALQSRIQPHHVVPPPAMTEADAAANRRRLTGN